MANISSKKLNARELTRIIRSEIIHGKLCKGDRIEPVRKLAEQFNVGRGIAYTSIENLKREGLLTSKGRSGIYVSDIGKLSSSPSRLRFGFYAHSGSITEDQYSMFHAFSCYGLSSNIDVTLAYDNGTMELGRWTSELAALLVTGNVDEALIAELKSLGCPFLVIGNYELEAECNIMQINIKGWIKKALSEVYPKLKFETFGMILRSPSLYAIREAIDAVSEMQSVHPFTLSDDDILFDPKEDGYKSMKIIMMRPKARRPQAILLSYQSVFGVARYINESGLKDFERPVFICKVQENFAKFIQGVPDISLLDDDYASLAGEVMNWLITLLNNPENVDKYETRCHSSPLKIVFN